MKRPFQDVVILIFLIPEAFAAFFYQSSGLERRDATNDTIPAPLVIPASEYWDGDDGEWSSLALRVGTPAQSVRALVSTNSPQTFVVIEAGCTTEAIVPVPDGCANARGGLFNNATSSTWRDQGDYGINGYIPGVSGFGVGLEANLGYIQYADYGLETLALGFNPGADEPTLENQTVAGIASVSPIYVGMLGLSTQPVNYTTTGNFSAPSFFTSLRSQNLIPSLSWSYTAGAKYRLKAGQYAQLIFGGFDSSRFLSNAAQFSLAGDIDRDIVVAIQSIQFSGTTQSSLLAAPIYAFIESTDVNLWLPAKACQAFVEAFGLTLDNSTGLYLINDTQYASLTTANPQVTFTLANDLTGGQTASIALPFAALALPATYPKIPSTSNSTYYFPLKTAANETQYTLGRTFLQEAYVTVDYERGNFSVSQCLWNDGAAVQLTSIISPTYKATTLTNTTTTSGSSNTKSTPVGAAPVAGGVVGGLLVIALLALGVFFWRRSKRTQVSETTGDIALANVTKFDEDKNASSSLYPNSPFSTHKNPYEGSDAPSLHSAYQHQPDSELSGGNEIHQLPDPSHLQDEDYAAAASRMKAAGTNEIDGTPVMYEMHTPLNERFEMMGDLPSPVEMDDERSRRGLLLNPAEGMASRGSSRSRAGPVSECLPH